MLAYSGAPAPSDPARTGTGEHERNGVTAPRPAAATFPLPRLRFRSTASIRSGGRYSSTSPTRNDAPTNSGTGTVDRRKVRPGIEQRRLDTDRNHAVTFRERVRDVE
jgi:hypothetical protein